MANDPEKNRSENHRNLDGKSIVRLTHTNESAAGTEIHLEVLNRILLQRNNLTIYQFYMSEQRIEVETQTFGKGTLIKIPLKFTKSVRKKELVHHKIARHLWYQFTGHDCYDPFYRTAVDFEKIITTFFAQHKIDIATNHFPGGINSLIFMKEAFKRGIPVGVINHFNNQWYRKNTIRKQLYYSQITAGLSNVNVPGFLKNRFVNISNGIDTDFFNPAILPKKSSRKNILFLPARIVSSKGQHDLLVITNNLKNYGIDCLAVFAGKIYDIDYKRKLDIFIEKHNLCENVLFTGQLSQEALRQWYRESMLVVFPSRHDEGLPRVVIEAQGMEIPPVCYNTGGTSEALLPGITGYMSRKGDLISLQKQIINLLSDDTTRNKMGRSGRAFTLEKFTLTALAERHEQLYSKLLSGC